MPPKDSPGTLSSEQGMVLVGLGNVQLTSQKYPVVLSLCSSWGQMSEHIIRVAVIDWGYRAALSQKPPKTLDAPQGTTVGSLPPASAKQTWAALAPEGAEPSQPFSVHMTWLRLPGFKLPALCSPLFLKRRDRWECTPSFLSFI